MIYIFAAFLRYSTAEDWELNCGSDKIEIILDTEFLEAKAGSKNYLGKKVFFGRYGLQFTNCHGNLNNIPNGPCLRNYA